MLTVDGWHVSHVNNVCQDSPQRQHLEHSVVMDVAHLSECRQPHLSGSPPLIPPVWPQITGKLHSPPRYPEMNGNIQGSPCPHLQHCGYPVPPPHHPAPCRQTDPAHHHPPCGFAAVMGLEQDLGTRAPSTRGVGQPSCRLWPRPPRNAQSALRAGRRV